MKQPAIVMRPKARPEPNARMHISIPACTARRLNDISRRHQLPRSTVISNLIDQYVDPKVTP